MGQEIECKLSVPDADALSRLRRAFSGQGAEETADYETVYFDLGDELNARRFMFRARKRGGGAAVYTVKTPGEGYARGEWECEDASPEEAAKKLAALGAPREIAERPAYPSHAAPALRARPSRFAAKAPSSSWRSTSASSPPRARPRPCASWSWN